jgi:ribonuclease-3
MLGYRFRDPSLFEQAVTHRSLANESPAHAAMDNERMEFLGDAILDFVITELIMERQQGLSEGQLSKLRASLVSEPILAELARGLGLGAHLGLGRGEELSGGRDKPSILSNALEALIAAIYLDSKDTQGIAAVAGVVRGLFLPRIESAEAARRSTDYKTELQELVHKRLKERVTYRVLREEGPDHDKQYEVAVYVEDREFGRGRGRSKKESEQAAARAALDAHFRAASSPP